MSVQSQTSQGHPMRIDAIKGSCNAEKCCQFNSGSRGCFGMENTLTHGTTCLSSKKSDHPLLDRTTGRRTHSNPSRNYHPCSHRSQQPSALCSWQETYSRSSRGQMMWQTALWASFLLFLISRYVGYLISNNLPAVILSLFTAISRLIILTGLATPGFAEHNSSRH